jgi:hypothetical protein
MNTSKLRTANLALSENKKNPANSGEVTKIKINIDIIGTIPMITMTDDLVNHATITEAINPATPLLLDNNNTIVDVGYANEHGVDRFTYITTTHSAITNNQVRMYYDAEFKDIIIIPEISFIDNTIDNTVYQLRGYRVGGGCPVDDISNDLMVPSSETFELPLTNSNISNVSKHMRLHGVARESSNIYYKELTSGDTIVNKKLATVAMIHLGSGDELFVDQNVRIPMYTVQQTTMDRYSLKFLNNIKPTSIYIPLNF